LATNIGTVDTVVNGVPVHASVTLWKICTRSTKCESGGSACTTHENCADPGDFNCGAEAEHYHGARALLIVALITTAALIVVCACDALRCTPHVVCGSFPIRKVIALVCGFAFLMSFSGFAVTLAAWHGDHCGPAAADIDGAKVGPSPFVALVASVACIAAGLCSLLLRTRLEKAEARQREVRAAEAAGRRDVVQLDYLGNVRPDNRGESIQVRRDEETPVTPGRHPQHRASAQRDEPTRSEAYREKDLDG